MSASWTPRWTRTTRSSRTTTWPFLAVRPDRQNVGIGSALLDRHHSRLDRAGIPAYLEANDPRNRDLYLRHGYTAVGDPAPRRTAAVADVEGAHGLRRHTEDRHAPARKLVEPVRLLVDPLNRMFADSRWIIARKTRDMCRVSSLKLQMSSPISPFWVAATRYICFHESRRTPSQPGRRLDRDEADSTRSGSCEVLGPMPLEVLRRNQRDSGQIIGIGGQSAERSIVVQAQVFLDALIMHDLVELDAVHQVPLNGAGIEIPERFRVEPPCLFEKIACSDLIDDLDDHAAPQWHSS